MPRASSQQQSEVSFLSMRSEESVHEENAEEDMSLDDEFRLSEEDTDTSFDDEVDEEPNLSDDRKCCFYQTTFETSICVTGRIVGSV